MALTDVVEALGKPRWCLCDCYHGLTLEERTHAVEAIFRFDDTMRGWGYQPVYERNASALFAEAQKRNDPNDRRIAVRDGECLYRRLLGFAVHEMIHALDGDRTKANYGIPFGLPYSVPEEVPEGKEAEFLSPFNRSEARAWVGIAPLAKALYGIEWTLRAARDVGTYGFDGGNALVDAPPGFRPVPHVDRTLHPQRFYALARKLEDAAAAEFTAVHVAELVAAVESAEKIGRAARKRLFPPAVELATIPPQKPGRNELCICGSGKKFKVCCGA
jgi:hypothetical protein